MAILPSSNLKFSEVRDILNANGGVAGNNMSSLFKASANINKWAKYKPESYDTMFGLIENDRYRNNYGLDLNGVHGITVNDLINNAINGVGWAYVLPSGDKDSPFRIGDFRGYNPDASAPFVYDFPERIETYVDTANATFRITKSPDSEIKLSDFARIEDLNLQNGKFAIAYKHEEWTASEVRFMYGVAYDPNFEEIIITGTLPKEGKYQVLAVITNETELSTNYETSLYLPYGYGEVDVVRKYAYATVTITNEYDINPNFSVDGNLYMFSNILQLSVTNSASGVSVPSTTGRLKFQILYYDSSDNYLGEFFFTDEGNGDFDYIGTGTKTYTLDYNAGAPIYLPDYVSYDMGSINKLEIYADIERVSGNGVFSPAKMYKWTVYKN